MERILRHLKEGVKIRVRSSQDGWVDRETRVKTVKQVEKKPMVLLTTVGGEYKIEFQESSYHLIDRVDNRNLGVVKEISLFQE